MSTSTELAEGLILAAVRFVRTVRGRDPHARLSGPLASALAVVVHADGLTLGSLAEIERVGRPAVTKIAANLESAGLVERRTDPTDGRLRRLYATDAGRRLLAEGQARHVAGLTASLDALSAEDRTCLGRAIQLIEGLRAAR